MKTFCAILLIGIIAYVQCNHDDCDKYAANTRKKDDKTHGEDEDQVIELDKFLSKNEVQYFVTHASRSGINGASQFCTAPTHGEGCLAVGYWRKITRQPEGQGLEEGADLIEFDTTFVAVAKDSAYAIRYEMKIAGVNADDYIFEGISKIVKATKILPDGKTIEDVTKQVTKEVHDVLKSKFALFFAGPGFTLYMTCDAKAMWVSYDSKELSQRAATQGLLQQQIARLVKKVKDAESKDAPKLIDVELSMIPTFKAQVPEVKV